MSSFSRWKTLAKQRHKNKNKKQEFHKQWVTTKESQEAIIADNKLTTTLLAWCTITTIGHDYGYVGVRWLYLVLPTIRYDTYLRWPINFELKQPWNYNIYSITNVTCFKWKIGGKGDVKRTWVMIRNEVVWNLVNGYCLTKRKLRFRGNYGKWNIVWRKLFRNKLICCVWH